MLVDRYTPAAAATWDAFLAASKNGTFLFARGYMDYHADRFIDHSLLIRDFDGTLRAILPGNADGSCFVSHCGLTYGGIVSGTDMKLPLMLEVFEAVASYLVEKGFCRWIYKTIPTVYHRYPAEEDRYALFLACAELYRRDMLAVVDNRARLSYQERRRRAVKKAQMNGLTCLEDNDLSEFWQVVTENLRLRYGVSPVHSLSEIELLRNRFPQNIRLFTSRLKGKILGGVLIYESETVAHVQYIASTEEGRKMGVLDIIIDYLLQFRYPDRRYFDFGISNEAGGLRLNRGLIEQKEGFGARALAHDHYTLNLTKYHTGQILQAIF